jgi:hypothetical protein
MSDLGINSYSGFDISDENVKNIEENILNYLGRFYKCDVGKEKVDQKADLIIMIDVTQHIVNDDKLNFCLLLNVKANLSDVGVFIVTDELSNKTFSFYEKNRSLQFYSDALGMELIVKPVVFRDKYIFAFKNNI